VLISNPEPPTRDSRKEEQIPSIAAAWVRRLLRLLYAAPFRFRLPVPHFASTQKTVQEHIRDVFELERIFATEGINAR